MNSPFTQETRNMSEISVDVSNHDEHGMITNQDSAPELLVNGKYAEVHDLHQQLQPSVCNSKPNVSGGESVETLTSMRAEPFPISEINDTDMLSTKELSGSCGVHQTVCSARVPDPDCGHPNAATDTTDGLAVLYSPVNTQPAPAAPRDSSAPAPLAARPVLDASSKCPPVGPLCAASSRLATLTQVSLGLQKQADNALVSGPPVVAPNANTASSPSAPVADTEPPSTGPSAPLTASAESGAERPPEDLMVACDPEECSLSEATAFARDTAATEDDDTALSADNASAPAAVRGAAAEGGAGESAAGEAAGESAESTLSVIGSVLLSADRLVFGCGECPELFSSAGRLRTHHNLQHAPPPSPPEVTSPPELEQPEPELVTTSRRRGRPPRSAAAAAAVTVQAVTADEESDMPEADPEYAEDGVGDDDGDGAGDGPAASLRRTRSGQSRAAPTQTSLKCDLCGKVLSSTNKLRVHQRMHSGERPHVCKFCPKSCNDLGNLRKHEQLHFKERPFRCNTCGITFWTALRQRSHHCKLSSQPDAAAGSDHGGDDVEMGYDVEIAEVGQNAASDDGGRVESRVADGPDPLSLDGSVLPPLVAPKPPREPSPEREPNINSGLTPVVPVDCDVCGRRLRSISGWQRHRRLHAGMRPYQCRYCDKSCNDSGNMRKHEAGHFKERPYRCDTCSITFASAWRLGVHQCKMRANSDGTAAAVDVGSAPTPAVGSGEVEVEAVLESKPALPVPPPRGRHAPPPQLDARGRRRDHVCPVCNKAMLSYASLEMHYRTHTGEKPYQCDECGKRFSIQGNLVVHTRIHTGERPFQCEECGKMFMYQSHLKVHKRGHSGAKPYHCQFCHKGFAASSSKRVHEDTVHTTERKFICEACGAGFKEKKHLKRHAWRKHQIGQEQVL